MKKLSLFILLVSLVCLVGLLAACNTETPPPQDPCANGHTEVVDAAVPATCTETGLSEGSHCSVCNKVLTAQQPVKLLEHTAGEWVDQIPATCTQTGVRQQPCSVCGTVLATETVASVEHEFGTWKVVTAATCQAKGTDERECGICGEKETREKAAKSHRPSGSAVVDRAATCSSDGLQHFSCVTCNMLIKYETVPALSHQYSDWTVTLAASCKGSGKKESTCDFCGHSYSEELPQLPHSMGAWIVDLEPTCDTEGSRHKDCSLCQSTVLTEKTDAKGHSLSAPKVELPATCQAEGRQRRTCSVCETVQTESIAKLEHTPDEWVIDAKATCTAAGSTHQSCASCGTVLATDTIAVLPHAYSTWQTLQPASCQTTGLEARVCSICKDTQPREIKRLSHKESADWIIDVAASCEKEGARHTYCTMCEVPMTREIVRALGHLDEDWTTITPATCISQGEQVRGCTRCDLSESRLLPTVSHTLESEWTIDVEATCSLMGSRHKKCVECLNVVTTETIDKASHTPADGWLVQKMPTATANGSSVKLCAVCGTTTDTATTRLEYGSAVALTQTQSVALGGYAVIYKQPNASAYFSAHITALETALKAATGSSFTAKTDSTAAVAKEILIGLTNRPESQAAYASLSGRAFTVRTVGDKIVIVGTDEALTLTALQYFINQYLGTSATVTMSVDATAPDLVARPLAPATGSNFVYVVDARLDFDPFHMYVGGSEKDSRDHPSIMFDELVSTLAKHSALPLSAFPRIPDTNTTHQNGYEVQFGEVNRTESLAFREMLKANEYGFVIWGNKVIITSHTDAGLEKALAAFLEFYDYLLATTGGVLPQGYSFVGAVTDQGWILDFPQPNLDNVRIENAQHNNDNSIQIIYTGKKNANGNATLADYTAYCTALEAAGYTIVQKNDNPGGTSNYFRLYQNAAKQHVLYVAYNAYSKQAEYANVYKQENVQYGDFIHYYSPDDHRIDYPMYTYKQCIRVVSAPLSTAYLPDAKLLTQQSYNKITSSSVTTVRLISGEVGMSYILQLEDGRLVIVDGGSNNEAGTTKNVLFSTLTELHKRATGSAPSTSNPIHIAAWLVTHSHGDHYSVMTSFLKEYVPTGKIKMDYLIGNFPELSSIYPVGGDTTVMGSGRIATLQGYFTSAGFTAFKYVKVHTGMSLFFANLKMEILMTYEDHAPFRITNSNDTNTVTKWTIGSTSAASGSISAATVTGDTTPTTWTMLGDSCIYASRWLCAMWGGNYNSSSKMYDGGYMAADMVQLAHHGNIGCEVALYKTVQPEVVWFPHNSNSYNSYTQNGKTNWTRHVDNTTINLSCVKYIVVSGINPTTSSSTDSITITLDENGKFPDEGSWLSAGTAGWGIKYNKSTGDYTVANIKYQVPVLGIVSTKVSSTPVIAK